MVSEFQTKLRKTYPLSQENLYLKRQRFGITQYFPYSFQFIIPPFAVPIICHLSRYQRSGHFDHIFKRQILIFRWCYDNLGSWNSWSFLGKFSHGLQSGGNQSVDHASSTGGRLKAAWLKYVSAGLSVVTDLDQIIVYHKILEVWLKLIKIPLLLLSFQIKKQTTKTTTATKYLLWFCLCILTNSNLF